MGESLETAALRTSGLFAGIADDDLEALITIGQEVSFEAGQAIFESGDQHDGMFIVLEGEAQVDVGGRFHRLKAGNFFGEMALLVPAKRMATVRAVEPIRALKLPSEAFLSFLLEHPVVAVSMLKALVVRLREVEQRLDAWMAP
jgi:CRP-like cAMP-binding protein